MYSYKKSSLETAKFHNENDLPTAAKSNYVDNSIYMNTPNLKSPSKIKSKIQDVRQSIGSMINQMSQKKSQNQNALERVRNVNADALRQINSTQAQFHTYTPQKSNRVYNTRDPRSGGALGGNEFYHNDIEAPGQGLGLSSQFNLNGNQGQYGGNSGPQYKSLEHENYELRKALNQHINFNNELLKRIYFLEAENSDLRAQLGYPQAKNQLRSTRYNSINYDDTNDFSPISPSRRVPAVSTRQGTSQGYIRNSLNSNPNANYGNSYNTIGNNVNNNVNGPNYVGSSNNFGSIPLIASQSWNGIDNNHHTAVLMNDLEVLKRQNESLRQNTIALLQRQ